MWRKNLGIQEYSSADLRNIQLKANSTVLATKFQKEIHLRAEILGPTENITMTKMGWS